MTKKLPQTYAEPASKFESPAHAEIQHVAEQASEPPPVAHQGSQAPQLVRPDRQFTYAGLPTHKWPPADSLHDGNTITVDRICDGIREPSHRFIIKRGDTVQACISKDRCEVGRVVGISHACGEVRVSLGEGGQGIWFGKSQIYPVAGESLRGKSRGIPLSEVITTVNHDHRKELIETDRVLPNVADPFSYTDFRRFTLDFEMGHAPFAEYRRQFERLWESQPSIKADLVGRFKAAQLAVLAARFGSLDVERSFKETNADHIVRTMLGAFVLGDVLCYDRLSKTYEMAVRDSVLAVTEAEYAREFEKQMEASLAAEEAFIDGPPPTSPVDTLEALRQIAKWARSRAFS